MNLLFSFSSFLSFFRIEWSTAAAAAGQAKKERWRWDAWINVTSSSVRPSLYPPDFHPPPSSMWHRTPVCTAPSSDNQQLNRWRMSSSPPTTSDNSARFFFSPFFLRSKKMYFFISAARASLSLARYSWGFFLSIFFFRRILFSLPHNRCTVYTTGELYEKGETNRRGSDGVKREKKNSFSLYQTECVRYCYCYSFFFSPFYL